MRYNVAVMIENYLPDIIGQDSVKQKLAMYKLSYQGGDKLPFLLFTGSRGSGKSNLARQFRETLVNKNGDTPPILEVNASAIRSVDSFYDQIYSKWHEHNATLFIDESHMLIDKLQAIFLTALEVKDDPVRRVTFEHKEMGQQEFVFDFRKMSIIFATTNQEKMEAPLVNRFEKIALQPYTEHELLQIFLKNIGDVRFSPESLTNILNVFRTCPRDVVKLANNIVSFTKAIGNLFINEEKLARFCKMMGLYKYGLCEAEMQIIKLLGERGACSLNAIAAATSFSKTVVQQDYEFMLLNKGLMDIDGKRRLTSRGMELYAASFK
jgi:Holliday junction resolvasome RuvABC ATP-dependent DNA helicase subunit|tara:strand:- start:2766 stop:3734 length:969 start_codon:yes stop_codon:yes gene_type:complete